MSDPKPAVDPYVVPILITLGVIVVSGLVSAVLVGILAPGQSAAINTWMILFLGPIMGVMFTYLVKQNSHIQKQLDGRLEQYFALQERNWEELMREKDTQRELGQHEGAQMERQDEAARKGATS